MPHTPSPQATIVDTKPRLLAGTHARMNFLNDQTVSLWQRLMPRRKEFTTPLNTNLYSIAVYDSLSYFEAFNPANEFEKWAAIEVAGTDNLPDGFDSIEIPGGLYAVFQYKGTPEMYMPFAMQIFGKWLPESEYTLDHRPHFFIMDDRYKRNDPESEEEVWVPIRLK